MARVSGAAVLLVPLCLYIYALLIGIQLGRELERNPSDSVNILSIRGVVQYFGKELWDTEQRGTDIVGRDARARVLPPVQASRHVGRPIQPDKDTYKRPDFAESGYEELVVESNHINDTYPEARSCKRHPTSPRGVIRVGPSVGGQGGGPFYMCVRRVPRIHSIILYHSKLIHSMACKYSLTGDDDEEANQLAVGPWGDRDSYGSKGVRATIKLSAGEHIIAVEGTSGKASWPVLSIVITSLTFRTNIGRTYGPYGWKTGTHFSIPAVDDSCIVGFWGRSGLLLDAIGVYINPSCSSNRTDKYPPTHGF